MNDLYDLNDWMNVFREATGKEPNESIVRVLQNLCEMLENTERKGGKARKRGDGPMSLTACKALFPTPESEQDEKLIPLFAELVHTAYMNGYEGADGF